MTDYLELARQCGALPASELSILANADQLTAFAARIREEAMEEAAKLCDGRAEDGPEAMTSEAMLCAAYIRALKEPR
jgi:hypothetical protein